MRRVRIHGESIMAREHSLGIVTGLILLASVLLMIGSLERASRTLRGPQAYPRALLHMAE
jgi:hypothetical protein